eukprot:scaffold6781_cov204-Amphora_coffeaeformis.AAC.17
MESTDADLVALQEVTPIFLQLLVEQSWVRESYALQAVPGNQSTRWRRMVICGYGNQKLFPMPLALYHCIDQTKHRSTIITWEVHPNIILAAANFHLLANPRDSWASLARQREISALLGQLQQIETSRKHFVPLLMGDWNADEGEPELTADGWFAGEAHIGGRTCLGFFRDAWLDVGKHKEGWTFNPQTNYRAKETRSDSNLNDIPKRNDRIYLTANQHILNPTQG